MSVVCFDIYQNKEGEVSHQLGLCVLIYIRTKRAELFTSECCLFSYQNKEGKNFSQVNVTYCDIKTKRTGLVTSECCIFSYQNKEGTAFRQ